MDWHFLSFDIHWLEKVLRTVAVYGFLIVAFRVAGKRELGQLTPFDLVVLLILSNALQNALIGKDDSLSGGLFGAFILLSVNGILARICLRYPWLEELMEGKPTLLIDQGKILDRNLRREKMTRRDLERALRKNDLDPETDIPLIKKAYLETDGSVTFLHDDAS